MERTVSSLAVATVEARGRETERERGKKKKDRTAKRRGRERATAAHTPMFKWWDKRILTPWFRSGGCINWGGVQKYCLPLFFYLSPTNELKPSLVTPQFIFLFFIH
jgi:hypothetical protein